MPSEVVVDEEARIVCAHYRGEISLRERLEVALQMLVMAERHRINRFLCDYRSAQASNAGDLDAPRVVEEFISRLPAGSRLAYVLKFDHQLDDALETLMRRHDRPVERFNDIKQAVAWLGTLDEPRDELQGGPPAPVPVEGSLDRPSVLRRTMRLAAEVVGSESQVSPDQFAAVGELVHDLLAKGVDEATVRHLASRMAAAMRA